MTDRSVSDLGVSLDPAAVGRRLSPMRTWAIAVAVSAVVLGVLDALWITQVAGPLYRAELGAVVREQFLLAPALAFYVIYLLGLTHFVTLPRRQASAAVAARDAAFFGVVAYGTYALTDWAVLEPFTAAVALPDLAWGAGVSVVTVLTARAVLPRLEAGGPRPGESG